MDVSCSLLSYRTPSSWNSPSSDSDRYNISSPEATSPSSYADLSPTLHARHIPVTLHSSPSVEAKSSVSPSSCEDVSSSRGRPRRTRSKNPSKQRQSASEKEKLRMRDLTKALHHLRTYLPPSVAPAGQTLTKIETLRLTIRYISHLSSQLGLGEESINRRNEMRPSHSTLTGIHYYSSVPEPWMVENRVAAYAGQHDSVFRAQNHYGGTAAQCQGGSDMEVPVCDEIFSSNLDSLLECPLYPEKPLTCQDYSKTAFYENTTPEFWI